ncbi:MAG: fructokinase [Colwellia sp.]|jgi:fructokinase
MRILSFGEVLVDLLSTEYQDDSNVSTEAFIKYAGGAPANVAVAAAKLGSQSYFLGKVGKDGFGNFLIDSLKKHNVSTDFVSYSEHGKTALAFIDLDAHGERQFHFYDDNAAHNDFHLSDFDVSIFNSPMLFHFCSGSLSRSHLKESVEYALKQLKQSNAIISLDINFRRAFWRELDNAADIILQIAEQANIVKASREELIELYGIENVDSKVKHLIDAGVALILITDGAEPISYYSKLFFGTFPSPKVDVVDTTAAGDSFIGGFLSKVANDNDSLQSFEKWISDFETVLSTIAFASGCGAHTVAKFGAFESLPYQEDITQ